MDAHLNQFLRADPYSVMLKWKWEDYKKDFLELLNVQVGEYRIIEAQFYDRASTDVLKSEGRICVPSTRVEEMLWWHHWKQRRMNHHR